jgi:hypothetical protein
LNTIKAQNVTNRGIQMARNAAVFAFLKSLNLDTSFERSTKISTAIAMAAQVKMSGSQIADEVADVRPLVLFAVNVTISDITLIITFVIQTIFPLLPRGVASCITVLS